MSQYDQEERTFQFALCIRDFLKEIPLTFTNKEYIHQCIRSSASISANYIEANDSLGKKDMIFRMRISRKEAKETILWLRLIDVNAESLIQKRQKLLKEAKELKLILSAIIGNLEKKK